VVFLTLLLALIALLLFVTRNRTPSQPPATAPAVAQPVYVAPSVPIPAAETPSSLPPPPVQPVELAFPSPAASTPPVDAPPAEPIERLPGLSGPGKPAQAASPAPVTDPFSEQFLKPGVARLESRIGKPSTDASYEQSRPSLH
jgi:hypothetical protein